MRRRDRVAWAFVLLVAAVCSADTIITREGASYSGSFLGAKDAAIGFTDTVGSGISRSATSVAGVHLGERHRDPTQREGLFRGNSRAQIRWRLKTIWEFSTSFREGCGVAGAEHCGCCAPPPQRSR
jgi:hypothetical protein